MPHHGKIDWDVKLAGVAGTSKVHLKTVNGIPEVAAVLNVCT